MVDRLVSEVKKATNFNIKKIHFICPSSFNDEGSCPLDFYGQMIIEADNLIFYMSEESFTKLKHEIYSYLIETLSDAKILNNFFNKSAQSLDSISQQQESLFLKLCEASSKIEIENENNDLYQDYQYGDKMCNLHDEYCSLFHSFMRRNDINKLTNHSLENGETETAIFSLDLVNGKLTWLIEEFSILTNEKTLPHNYIGMYFNKEYKSKLKFEALDNLLKDIMS